MKKITVVFLLLTSVLYSEELTPTKNQGETDASQDPAIVEKQPDIFELSSGKKLRWKFNVGDVLEIKKKSLQHVKVNLPASSSQPKKTETIDRDLFYRITLDTIGTDPEKGYLMDSTFHTLINYKQNKVNLFQEQDSLDSTFFIQPRGQFLVPPGSYMPNVRDIPVFPEKEEPGDKESPMEEGFSWSYPGVEIMQVADNYEYIPLNVKYEYRGVTNITEGEISKPIHRILYNVQFNHTFRKTISPDNPRQIFGYVTSRLLWDEREGIPHLLTEDYDIVVIFNSGESQEFRITSRSDYLKKKKRSAEEKEIMRTLLADKLGKVGSGLNFQVLSNSNGISIQIPDILFDYNSYELTDESEKTLGEIGSVLENYVNANQILVRGHTDKIGSDDYNLKLSKKRAAEVAGYLYKNLNIPVENISFEGVGSKFPISDNKTENGRKKNRRVEILILDK